MRILASTLLLPVLAWAQADPVPPPPAAPPTSEAAVSTTLLDDREEPSAAPGAAREEAPLPEKILEPPPPEAAPSVSIRTDGSGDVVEEYRQNGRIYMVKVRPPRGVPYTLLDTNGDGQLDQHDGEGPVRPVYYTVYEWN
jgi:hypothetical protein